MLQPKRIAVLLFDEVNAIDVAGPTEVFATARVERLRKPYVVETWSLGARSVRCESGLTLAADFLLPHRRSAHTLLIPGGRGLREPAVLQRAADFLRQNHERFARVVSVCTGAYALAESGLMDGRPLTTHWAHATRLQSDYPTVRVTSDALFTRTGKFCSSGGVTAGIDLALDLVAQDFGRTIAMQVAQELVVFLKRSGFQSQFSTPLQAQARIPSRLEDAVAWASSNLDRDLGVEFLAARAGMSVRQFSRVFASSYGEPPAAYIKRLRLDTARSLLFEGGNVGRVAHSVGFQSEDGFRRAFQKVFGVTPVEYRRRFGSAKETG